MVVSRIGIVSFGVLVFVAEILAVRVLSYDGGVQRSRELRFQARVEMGRGREMEDVAFELIAAVII